MFIGNLCNLGKLYNHYEMEQKSSVFFQCLAFLLCITQVFGERSLGPIPKTLK